MSNRRMERAHENAQNAINERIAKPQVVEYVIDELNKAVDEFSNSRELFKELDELSERFKELDTIGQSNSESSEA